MRYSRIAFKFVVSDSISFPANPVNTFRGALGFQLLRIACIQRKTSDSGCKNCTVFEKCAYARCFETGQMHVGEGFSTSNDDMPHFMAVDCGFPGEKTFQAGSSIEFAVQLYGRGVESVPYIIVAARNAGMLGLTRQRIVCDLESVYDDFDKRVIWSRESDNLQIPEARVLSLSSPDLGQLEEKTVCIKFITPTAFKDKRSANVTLEPDFARIIGSLMRRYSSFEASEGVRPDWSYAELSRIARQVKLRSINVAPVYWERFSSRQHQRIPVTGIIGQAVFSGPVQPFYELLKAGEIIRCGRSTTFGQGRISFNEISGESAINKEQLFA